MTNNSQKYSIALKWEIIRDKKIWKLQDKKWVVMTKGFCIGMKLKLYLLLSIGIRSLIQRKIDEKLSDTGLREV